MKIEEVLSLLKTLENKVNANLTLELECDGSGVITTWKKKKEILSFETIEEFKRKVIMS